MRARIASLITTLLAKLRASARAHPRIWLAATAATLFVAVIVTVVLTTDDASKPVARPAPRTTTTSTSTTSTSTTSTTTTTTTTVPRAPRPAVPNRTPRTNSPEPPPQQEPIACSATSEPTTGTVPSDDELAGKRWVTVGTLAGNCDAQSGPFHVRGIDTRIWYRSDADSFVVWVVDAVQGLDATAGFADVECAGACAEQQILTLPAGDYYLKVQAGDAPWQATLQEYRAD